MGLALVAVRPLILSANFRSRAASRIAVAELQFRRPERMASPTAIRCAHGGGDAAERGREQTCGARRKLYNGPIPTRDFAMHDIKWIRDNPEAFDRGLARRGLPAQSGELIELDEKRR